MVAGQKRKRGLKESRREDGKLVTDLIDDDEGEVQAPAPAPAVADPVVVKDDDAVFVTTKPVRKKRAERENAARPW